MTQMRVDNSIDWSHTLRFLHETSEILQFLRRSLALKHNYLPLVRDEFNRWYNHCLVLNFTQPFVITVVCR